MALPDFSLSFRKSYEPMEDSFLMARHLSSVKPFGNGLAVDVGTGSGIQAIVMASNGWDVVATDIDMEAVLEAFSNARRNGLSIRFSVGHLMSHLSSEFSLMVFNPPYLHPSSVDFSGKHWLEAGEELLHEFFAQALKRLHEGGKALVVHSSNGPDASRIGKESGFMHRIVAKESFFFERLFLSEFRRE